MAGKFGLQRDTMRCQLIDHARAGCRSESAHEHMCALKVGRNINSVDGDEHACEVYFARNDCAQLTFYDFVYA